MEQHLALSHWNQCQHTNRNSSFSWRDTIFLYFIFVFVSHPNSVTALIFYFVLWLLKGRKDWDLDHWLDIFVVQLTVCWEIYICNLINLSQCTLEILINIPVLKSGKQRLRYGVNSLNPFWILYGGLSFKTEQYQSRVHALSTAPHVLFLILFICSTSVWED